MPISCLRGVLPKCLGLRHRRRIAAWRISGPSRPLPSTLAGGLNGGRRNIRATLERPPFGVLPCKRKKRAARCVRGAACCVLAVCSVCRLLRSVGCVCGVCGVCDGWCVMSMWCVLCMLRVLRFAPKQMVGLSRPLQTCLISGNPSFGPYCR